MFQKVLPLENVVSYHQVFRLAPAHLLALPPMATAASNLDYFLPLTVPKNKRQQQQEPQQKHHWWIFLPLNCSESGRQLPLQCHHQVNSLCSPIGSQLAADSLEDEQETRMKTPIQQGVAASLVLHL